MNSKVFLLIVLSITILNVLSDEFDIDLGEDTEELIDFGDMFTYDTNTKTNLKANKIMTKIDSAKDQCDCHHKSVEDYCPKQVSNCDKILDKLEECQRDKQILSDLTKSSTCNQRVVTFVNRALLKLIIKLKQFDEHMAEEEYILISAHIKPTSVQFIEHFISQTKLDCQRVDDFEDVFYEVIQNIYFDHSNNKNFVHRLAENYWFIIVVCLCLLLFSFLLYQFCLLSKWAKCLIIYGLFLNISFVWQWIQLYQMELSKRHLTVASAPKECLYMNNDNHLTMSSVFSSYVKSWTSIDKKCEEYYRALMVAPIFEINPLVAVSHTLSLAFFTPISIFGNQLGKGLSQFYHYFNFYEKFLITGLLVIITTFALILLMGYSIRLPFLLGSIVRGPQTSPRLLRVDSNTIRDLSNQLIDSIQPHSQRSDSFSLERRRRALQSNEQNINNVSNIRRSVSSAPLRRIKSTTSLSQF